jgi:hypothetical protein
MSKAVSSMRSLRTTTTGDKVIEAETRWATFVAAFLLSDQATKLFKAMYPDSEIAKKLGIVKVGLSPHFTKTVLESMSTPFSLLMDESNDKTQWRIQRGISGSHGTSLWAAPSTKKK